MTGPSTIYRGFRYRLEPTPEQAALFRQFAGVCRLVYNLGLEQRRDWWRHYRRETGSNISAFSQCRELTALRAEFDWIAAVPCHCQQHALHDLDKAFQSFFAGRGGYPAPRKLGVDDAFRFSGCEVQTHTLNAKWSAVRLPKIGWVKFRSPRPMRGKITIATVSLTPIGWHISFACKIEHTAPLNARPAVGIDRGVANTLTLSTGESLSVPPSLAAIERRIRKAQRVLARRKRGSNRRRKQLRRVAHLRARAARVRQDFCHKASHAIAERFGLVALEALNVVAMTATAAGTFERPGRNVRAKAGLNRSILNQGWGQFETLLAYKMAERGGRIVKVDPAYTSQTCASCGTVDARSRKSQAAFECITCGRCDHADVNAAIEILRRGSTPLLRVEVGAQARPAKREPLRRKPRKPLAIAS